ncbi:MAG: ATP-binding cassette domain-containing protein [Bacteroidota bacterium]
MNLTAKNITKRYATQVALNNVSIEVPERSIFGLLGPNGAGKTSLIRIINMITAPDQGELFLGGKKLNAAHKEIIGYLPEERGLYKKMKVGEQAVYLAQLKGLNRTDATRHLKQWFTRFEILGWWNRKVEELSKGMQQKIQFIVTVIHQPKLLIFDEPFSGFDPINANLIRDEILQLREDGATVIFSTHNMSTVEELCDDIALINKSNIILDGKMSDIKNNHKSNMYSVELSGLNTPLKSLLNGRFELTEEQTKDTVCTARIQLKNTDNPNDLLSVLLPHAQVRALNEIIPTMNDIFISKVNNDSSKSQSV